MKKTILQFFAIGIVAISAFLSWDEILFALHLQPDAVVNEIGKDEFSQRENEAVFLKKYIGDEKIISYVSDPPCDAYCQMTTSYAWVPVIIDYIGGKHKYTLVNFSNKEQATAYAKENLMKSVKNMNNLFLLSNEKK